MNIISYTCWLTFVLLNITGWPELSYSFNEKSAIFIINSPFAWFLSFSYCMISGECNKAISRWAWSILKENMMFGIGSEMLHCCCEKWDSEEIWKNECHFVHQSIRPNSLKLNHTQQQIIIEVKQSYVWIGNLNTVDIYNDQ
jgi:hypothetical protein